jgi:hypothetical protein
MRQLTEEEKEEIQQKVLYSEKKSKLLKIYKAHTEDLAQAEDLFDEGLILEKRATLAKEIKALASKIKEIEKLEVYV